MLVDFYRIIEKPLLSGELASQDQTLKKRLYLVELNPSHPVYQGHFPGNPIVPGVCQVQIIKELVALTLQKEIIMIKSDNIKFLSMIVPAQTPILEVRLDITEKEKDQWDVNAIISSDKQVFLKFRGGFKPDY